MSETVVQGEFIVLVYARCVQYRFNLLHRHCFICVVWFYPWLVALLELNLVFRMRNYLAHIFRLTCIYRLDLQFETEGDDDS
jgi:hypothetical protein